MTEPESIQVIEEDHQPTDYHLIKKEEWNQVVRRLNRFENYHSERATSQAHLEHEIARLNRWNRRYLAATWFTVFFYPFVSTIYGIWKHT